MKALSLIAVAGALILGACTVSPLSMPEATLDNIQTVRAAGLPAMNVGPFSAAPGRPTDMDKQIAARGGVDAAPEGSFAKYLADTLGAQLKGAGKYDAGSPLVVTGVITDTYLVSELQSPSARLAARFTLTRNGKPVYTKELKVSAAWDWQYLADVAVPDAFNHYAGLFPQLINQLLADPDFQAAAKAG